jgi:hypothetical protein
MRDVHLCTWASHGDIQVACDEARGRMSSRAAWAQPSGLPDGVYARDDGELYAFGSDGGMVTCSCCVASRGGE